MQRTNLELFRDCIETFCIVENSVYELFEPKRGIQVHNGFSIGV
jgi:hypothetical protein